MTTLDLEHVRSQFPALARTENGLPAAYLDGPGGTQVPLTVANAMGYVLTRGVSNLGGGFGASRFAEDLTAQARTAVANLFNSEPEDVSFGQNMTSITFALSRALATEWQPGDSVVLTSLDHDANFTPWVRAARDRGVEIRIADFDVDTGTLDPSAIESLVDNTTRLVAVCLASNSIGTVVDVAKISEIAHSVRAELFVDAVHAAPHRLLDVQALAADFLVASAYKFFGPHTGILYGRSERLAAVDFYRVRPAPSDPPGKMETGTQSFESLAGVTAAVDYLARLQAQGDTRREQLEAGYAAIRQHEDSLARQFVDGVARLAGVRIVGVPDVGDDRVSTFAVEVEGHHPKAVAKQLAGAGIYVWAGHYYAVNAMQRLGCLDSGGLVRIGFVHYNTTDEVDRTLTSLSNL